MASGLAELALQAVELHALPKGRTAAVFQTVAQPADKSFERALAAEVGIAFRSEEHTSELQSLMRISYAVFCLKNKTIQSNTNNHIRVFLVSLNTVNQHDSR